MHHSLTVVLSVRDAAACQLELDRQRSALELGWARVPGLLSACLAFLPAQPGSASPAPALLFECSFETDFADVMFVSFKALGQPLSAVFSHCSEYPESPEARTFAAYLGARARRSSTFRTLGPVEFEPWRRLGRAWDAFADSATQGAPEAALSEAELEARRLAVGMQEPVPGAPLLHVAWLMPDTRARVKRALRDLDLELAPLDGDARFLVDDARLLFLAYPNENAQRWSERLSQVALAPLCRIWRNGRGFPRSFGVRRLRRERRLQRFVLDHRVPVAAWFNARHPSRGTVPEY